MPQHNEKWTVARRARVKQVKHRTYASMVSVPLCTKFGNVGRQQRELRFPLGILHCHALPPACWEREAKALIPTGSLYCERRKGVLLSVCAFPLPYLASGVSIHHSRSKCIVGFCRSGEPSPIALWHLSTALGVAWARQVTLLGQGHMSFNVLLFLCLYFARKCGLPAKAQSVMQSGS